MVTVTVWFVVKIKNAYYNCVLIDIQFTTNTQSKTDHHAFEGDNDQQIVMFLHSLNSGSVFIFIFSDHCIFENLASVT